MPPHIRGVLKPFLPHPTAPALTHLRCGLRYAAHMVGSNIRSLTLAYKKQALPSPLNDNLEDLRFIMYNLSIWRLTLHVIEDFALLTARSRKARRRSDCIINGNSAVTRVGVLKRSPQPPNFKFVNRNSIKR